MASFPQAREPLNGEPQRWETFASAYDSRRNNFDCLRFMLASLVIWSHCYALSASGRTDWIYWLSGQIDGGSLAVDSFFVLSGFLVTQSWMRCPQLMPFARKRALRLVPALFIALAFGALVIGPLTTAGSVRAYLFSSAPWLHFLGVALNRYLFLPTLFVNNPVPRLLNSPLWSLRFEILCYLMVPLLVVKRPRFRLTAVMGAFSLAWLYFLMIGNTNSVPCLIARLFACFAAGMIFYMLRAVIPFRRSLAVAALMVLALTCWTGGFRQAFPIAGGYLLLYTAFSGRLPLQRFGRYGDFSYGLYVFAYPIQQAVVYELGASLSVPVFFFLSFVPTLLVAIASWHLVEAPALALKEGATQRLAVPFYEPGLGLASPKS